MISIAKAVALIPIILMIVSIVVLSVINRETIKGRSHHHGGGIYEIDLYAHHSRLLKWNTNLKAVLSIGLLLTCIVLNDALINLFIIAYCAFITIAVGNLHFRTYLSLLLIPIFFLVTSSMILLIEYSSGLPVSSLFLFRIGSGYLYTDLKHLRFVAVLFTKALGALSAMLMLILSTPAPELFGSLERLHCPELILELMQMIYRFIFIMIATQKEMAIAADSRLGMTDYKTALRSFGLIAANLLIVSIKRANDFYDALESRLYTGRMPFQIEKRPVDPVHILFVLSTFGYILIIYMLEYGIG